MQLKRIHKMRPKRMAIEEAERSPLPAISEKKSSLPPPSSPSSLLSLMTEVGMEEIEGMAVGTTVGTQVVLDFTKPSIVQLGEQSK
jgi:hypothetical protein